MKKNIILFTLPFAGGSSFSYSKWGSHLYDIKLISLDYAGHGKRFKEKLIDSFEELVEDIVEKILSFDLESNEFCVYGHSLGAMIAYHVVCVLEQKYNLKPLCTMVGACFSPKDFETMSKFQYKDEEIKKRIVLEGRVPKEFIYTNEFEKIIYPAIKNDFKLVSEYRFQPQKLLASQIYRFCGTFDFDIDKKAMDKWSEYSKYKSKTYMIDGNHFFLETNIKELCSVINSIIEERLDIKNNINTHC